MLRIDSKEKALPILTSYFLYKSYLKLMARKHKMTSNLVTKNILTYGEQSAWQYGVKASSQIYFHKVQLSAQQTTMY